jgi:hypothetical protein
MVEKERAPSERVRVRELAERLGIALGARALLALIEELLTHRGIDI